MMRKARPMHTSPKRLREKPFECIKRHPILHSAEVSVIREAAFPISNAVRTKRTYRNPSGRPTCCPQRRRTKRRQGTAFFAASVTTARVSSAHLKMTRTRAQHRFREALEKR